MTMAISTYSDADYYGEFASTPELVLTNYSLRMMGRKNANDATVYINLTDDDGGGLTKLADITDRIGWFSISIPQAVLVKLPEDEFQISVIAYDAENRIEIGRGVLTHQAGPTRWVE